ncbi:MAG TPA: TonB-dependent receptor [Opitutaceae bacterium]|nr:TonB-dependent receptor [Opitutaceae bacterium]
MITLCGGLSAQTPDASSSRKSNEILTLPEFSVRADSADGSYTVGDTVSGSRMNVEVKNLPYSINSLTSEFLQDFSVFNLTDDLSYMSAITGNTDSFTFTARGYSPSNNVLYNGHFQTSPIVSSFVERVELIKGTSGSIYGQGSPGGALLITTRLPRARPQQSMSLSYGSYDLTNVVVHSTGPLVPATKSKPKFFYNVDAAYMHRNFDVPTARRQEKAAEAGITYRPNDRTSVTIEGTWQKFWLPFGADWGLPYLGHFANNPSTGKTGQLYYDGFAWPLRYQPYGATGDYVSRESTSWVGTFQQRITDWLSFQTSYNHYVVPVETYNTLGSSGIFFPSVGLIASGSALSGTNNPNPKATANPTWSTIMGTGWSVSGDLLAHYRTGKVDNQTLFTFDDYLNNRRNYTGTAIPGTYTPFSWAFNPYGGVTAPYIPRDANHWRVATTLNNSVESRGFNFAQRSVFFDGRLALTGGYRHDRVMGYQTNPNQPNLSAVSYPGAAPGSGRQSKIHSNNDGASLGVSIELTPSLSWYAGASQSFLPFGTSVPLTVTLKGNSFAQEQQIKTLSPASEKALGGETGFKMNYLDHTLVFTADVFRTRQKNVGVKELSDPTDPASPTVSVNEGDQAAQGFEFDGEYNRGAWHGYLSFSYLDARVENQGINVLANGHRPRAAPYDSLAASLTYAVPQVRGLKLLTSVRYQGNTPQQSPSTGGIFDPATGVNDHNNGQMNLRTLPYSIWTFGVSYRWKTAGSKVEQSINCTLKNAFNKQYLQPGSSTDFVGDGRGGYITYSLTR